MDCDVLIVGGGFAGLSAATALAERGIKVVLLEKKPHLGGRAYSFDDRETESSVDNGQHLFLGSYLETRKFLARIGSEHLLKFSSELHVDLMDTSGARDQLHSPQFLPAPINFAWGILGLKGVSLRDKILSRNVLGSIKKLQKHPAYAEELDQLTVRQWLNSLKQTPLLQERLWDLLAIGILNESPEIASALGLAQALKTILLEGKKDGANPGFSSVGLSALYTEQAHSYLKKMGGRVVLSSKAVSILYEGDRIAGIECENKERYLSQTILFALAPWELRRLNLPDKIKTGWENLKASPIIGLSLWLDRPIFTEKIIGLIGTEFQWAFNKSRLFNLQGNGQYLSLVISAARRSLLWEPKKFLELAKKELAVFPGFEKAKILHWRLVKEPYATLSPEPGSEGLRPAPGRVAAGLYLAGDWTRTGLPATIESAVLSGHVAARLAFEEIKT